VSSRNPFAISVENNFSFVFDERTLGEVAIQGSEGVRTIIAIVVSKNLLNFLCYIWGMVERNLREEMMRDMIMRDIVEEVTAHPAKEGAVNRCRGTTKERPAPLAEMWQDRVGVLQKNQGNDPMIGQEIWNYVNHCEMFERSLVGKVPEGRSRSDNPRVLQEDSNLGGILFEQRGANRVVVRSGGIHFVT